jgi:hypothetical protein
VFAIANNEAFEVIRLKDSNKTLVDYEDSADVKEMRRRLEKWNSFLGEQWTDLYITDDEFYSANKQASDADDDDFIDPDESNHNQIAGVDLSRNRLYRVFNNSSFNNGGRFYGGWWQSIPSKWRQFVTINWHPTRELDFSSMQPAMLYAKCGLPLEDDAYSLKGVDAAYRKLLKKTFLQLINARKDQRMRPPPQASLPPGMTWKALQDALVDKHKAIEKFFRTGIGIELQRLDAEIANAVMLRMMEHNMLVLPIHDSFLIRWGHHMALRDHMVAEYRKHFGQKIEVTLDLSFADKLAEKAALPISSRVISSYEAIKAEFDEAAKVKVGYEGYFARKSAFLCRQTRAWYARFNPY